MKTIELLNLLYLLIPVIAVWYFYKKWVGNENEIVPWLNSQLIKLNSEYIRKLVKNGQTSNMMLILTNE